MQIGAVPRPLLLHPTGWNAARPCQSCERGFLSRPDCVRRPARGWAICPRPRVGEAAVEAVNAADEAYDALQKGDEKQAAAALTKAGISFISLGYSVKDIAALAKAVSKEGFRKGFLACFAAGTRVQTGRGWLPIEEVRSGDVAWSRPDAGPEHAGSWRKVTFAFTRSAPILEVLVGGEAVRTTAESGSRAGYDGAKKKNGSKVHIAVDTLGHLLALKVTGANEQERAQVAELSAKIQEVTGDTLEVAFADQRYTGENAATQAIEHGVKLEVVKHTEAKKGFVLLPRRWVVERTFGWLGRFRRLLGITNVC